MKNDLTTRAALPGPDVPAITTAEKFRKAAASAMLRRFTGPHHNLAERERQYLAHVLANYGPGRQGAEITADTVGHYSRKYCLTTLALCSRNLNSTGEALHNRIANRIEVEGELTFAASGAMPEEPPVYLTVQARLNIHLLFNSILTLHTTMHVKDAPEMTLIEKRVAQWCGDNFASILPPDNRPKSVRGTRIWATYLASMNTALDSMYAQGAAFAPFATFPKVHASVPLDPGDRSGAFRND